MEFTPQSLAQRLVDLNLVEQHRVDQIWGEMRRGVADELEEFKSLALRKELVTNFQLDRVLTGERLGYFYGPYKVLYLIGAGTFARVFRAVHKNTGRVVAVKVLRRRHRNEVKQIEQFLREGRMGLELRHPNIVTVFEIQNDPRTPYLVMEFVEGETLRHILKIRGKFNSLDALRVMKDICTGLDFAFSKGVTHRDLKLSNVLVSSTGRCKLVDFGLAALADTSSNEAIADCPSARAIDYAALERGTGVKKGDPRSDIYFTGAIFYHILAGEPALTETRDRMARLNVTRLREIPPISNHVKELPQAVMVILNKALEFDPEKRYQSPAAMLRDVEKAIQILESGGDATAAALEAPAIDESDMSKEGEGKTIMVVENRLEFQNLLREKLKNRGYRVLVLGDPVRAMNRLSDSEEHGVDCIIISAVNLGNEALDFFNNIGQQEHTKDLPMLLLIDQRQTHIIERAQVGKNHRTIAMPLKVRELRETILQLFENVA
jgi:serine/threonine-protein kinase